jgi:hypothetical protein
MKFAGHLELIGDGGDGQVLREEGGFSSLRSVPR